jgi:colanic acid/amylovoran biosynthesis glycosyltransferase
VRPRRVAFVLSKFPCYDEAFLLREIHSLAQWLDVWVVSLRRANEPVVHQAARELLPRTVYLPYLLSAELSRAHARLMTERPRSYVRALRGALAPFWRRPGALVKTSAFFPKAVLLARWAEGLGIDHLHGGWATFPATAVQVASELSGIPFSFSAHAHDLYLDPSGLAEKIRRAAFVTTCTDANRRYLETLVPSGAKPRIELVHHGLRLREFAREDAPSAQVPLLSVGTLNPHKGFSQLLDALDLLSRRNVDYRATLVGGGPLEGELRRRLRERGLEGRVHMTGALAQEDVARHYGRSRVFVLVAQPEWHWGIPNVIIEALAARNAVVTTRFGSVEELVRDGETGLLVPPRDPAAVADALERLCRDATLRERLAETGHAKVAREFDLERTTEQYLALLGSATRKPPEAEPSQEAVLR